MQTPNEFIKTPHVPSRVPSLNEAEAANAVESLYTPGRKALVESQSEFRKIDRRLKDPPIPGQRYAIFSWVPSKNAVPDEDGVYGMIKIRGTFQELDDADKRAEFLVRNTDSMHSILTGYVGTPMPLISVLEQDDHINKYGAKLNEIKLSEKVDDVYDNSVVQKREQEKQSMREMTAREEELRRDVAREPTDKRDIDTYIEQRMKRSQLIVTLTEGHKRLRDIGDILRKTQVLIDDMDAEHPDFRKEYSATYRKAREMSGVPADDQTYIQHMDTDYDLDLLLNFVSSDLVLTLKS